MNKIPKTLSRFGLLVIILAAFALRIYKLDAQSFWYDEGVSAKSQSIVFLVG